MNFTMGFMNASSLALDGSFGPGTTPHRNMFSMLKASSFVGTVMRVCSPFNEREPQILIQNLQCT